jgi:hypothetical protein
VTWVDVRMVRFGRVCTLEGRYAAEVDERVPPESIVA